MATCHPGDWFQITTDEDSAEFYVRALDVKEKIAYGWLVQLDKITGVPIAPYYPTAFKFSCNTGDTINFMPVEFFDDRTRHFHENEDSSEDSSFEIT